MTHPHSHGPPGEPLLPRSSLFEYKHRPVRDFEWSIGYLIVTASTIGGGIYAFLHRNTMFSSLTGASFDDPKMCPYGALSFERRLLQDPTPAPFDIDLFFKTAAVWIGASAVGSLLLGLLFVSLVRHHARLLVSLALFLQVAAPVFAGVLALSQGALPAALALFAVAGLLAFAFLLWSPQIHVVTGLLGAAGQGLTANPGLVPTSLGINLAMLIFEAPLALSCLAAVMNGTLAFNHERDDKGSVRVVGHCVSRETGEHVSCCVWKTDSWVPGYFTLASIAMLWTLMVAFQVKLFTVAGTTAQWYFNREESGPAVGRGPEHGYDYELRHGHGQGHRHGPVRSSEHHSGSRACRSLGHALGPSFGSICMGGAVLTLCSLVKQVMERVRRERERSLLLACADAILSGCLAIIEYVSKFATIFAAITGESWLQAGEHVTSLLYRNGMDALGVWWLSPMVVHSLCATISTAWAVAVWALSRNASAFHGQEQGPASAVVLAVIALVTSWIVLDYFGSLLLNIVDALFVCLGMDREARVVSKVEIHELYSHLPSVGPVIQIHDDGVGYGAPASVPEHLHSKYCEHSNPPPPNYATGYMPYPSPPVMAQPAAQVFYPYIGPAPVGGGPVAYPGVGGPDPRVYAAPPPHMSGYGAYPAPSAPPLPFVKRG